MAFIKRFSDIKKGGIAFIGNSSGLSKITNANNAGQLGSIGAFTSLNTAIRVNDFPYGTTLNYLQNGSSATLNLPQGSTVVYAELIWGGLYKSSTNNISTLLDNNILFTTPTSVNSVAPSSTTKQTFTIPLNNINVGFYVRSQDVTNIVSSSTNGTYSVEKIPSLIEAIDNRTNDTNHCGWTLAVVYLNSNLPFRSLNLWVGGEVVSPLIGVTNISLTGFKTPTETTPSGKLFVSAQEGDAVISGDQLLFSKDSINYSNLSGPNNPVNNFFCSQINNEYGVLDTSGTFGNRNANSLTGNNTTACRQGYDITAVDLTGKLSPAQSTAYIRFTSSGDLYLPNCLAIQIDNGINPEISIIKTVDKSVAVKGESLKYTSIIANTGSLPFYNINFNDAIPDGTIFIDGSVYIDGINYPTYNPQTGFLIPNLIPTQTTTITFQVQVL